MGWWLDASVDRSLAGSKVPHPTPTPGWGATYIFCPVQRLRCSLRERKRERREGVLS